MTAPNIGNFNYMFANSNVQAVGTGASSIVTNGAGSGQVFKIYSLSVANYTTTPTGLTADFYRSSIAYRLAGNINIPANSSMVLITKDNGIYLNEGDSLRLTASAVSSLEAVCSFEVIG
jgi:hypothetical protein